LINKLNITCFEAENGQDALSVIDKHKEISHVFLDLNMPVMDGYGFLHFINSGDKHKDLNIYVTTVSDRRDFTDTIAKRNIDISNIKGYSKKPFNMADLANSLLTDNQQHASHMPQA
jgi:response regulator RpfG family c-di-GMP phosphodiesterase